MILNDADKEAPPLAWARLLLPEPRMSAGWRNSDCALFVLHIERRPWDPDSPLAPPIPFLNWHNYFTKVLECPSALANFLGQDLGLDIPMRDPKVTFDDILGDPLPIASVGMWLVAPQVMTDLIDISGFQQLPGSPMSPRFDAYAVADTRGSQPANMAVDWMQQMSDFVLHFDGHDSALLALRQ